MNDGYFYKEYVSGKCIASGFLRGVTANNKLQNEVQKLLG
jgi:hypothetical protein